MLQEIVITPSAFECTSYSSQDTCDAHFDGLRQALLEWTIVRDLRDGEWKEAVHGLSESMSSRSRELWKKILKQGRAFEFQSCGQTKPQTDAEWCAEAITSVQHKHLLGILTSETTKTNFAKDPLIASVQKRGSALWWKHLEAGHPDGHQSTRFKQDYISRLDLILRHANSLYFVDPHLDPQKKGYTEFLDIIQTALDRAVVPPMIQIHRCCYEGSGSNRNLVSNAEWESRFRTAWASDHRTHGIEVFIWSNSHDRHLLTNLIGIHLGNGFDTSPDVTARVSWSRISKHDLDSMLRTVDPSAEGRHLIHRFRIGV